MSGVGGRRASTRAARPLLLAAIAVLVTIVAGTASAAERYALIVTGANGEPAYAAQFGEWRQAASVALVEKFGFDPAHVVTLFDGGDAAHAATATAVRHTLDEFAAKMRRGDVLLILLMGHGSFDGAEAKFNLVGPDLTSAEWAALVKPLPGTLVFVNAAAASAPFLEHLAQPGRVVITATDSAAQRFDTVFPEYFLRGLSGPDADLDKNGRVSIWEAFAAASVGVKRYFTERGQLATERALLDDDGDGKGREAGGEGTDGPVAARLYLDPDDPGAAPTDDVLLGLLQKRASLQVDAEDLRQRRVLMTPAEYQAEFERLMIELARVSRRIRERRNGSQ
jgi:hypothetical protein